MDDLSKFIEQEIGIILRRARKEKGLSIEEVATALETSESDIENIELHTGEVTLGMLQKYAEFMGKNLQIKFLNSRK